MLIRQFFEDVYAPIRGLRPKCEDQYRLTIARFSEFLGRPAELADLTDVNVQRFAMARNSMVSTATAVKDRAQLSAMANVAAKKRLLSEFLVLPRMKAPKRVPMAYTSGDVEKLINATARLGGTVSDAPAVLWWGSLILCQWLTGERIGGHLGLTWRDVALDRLCVRFPAEERKGHSVDLIKPINDTLAGLLGRLREASMPRALQPSALVWAWDRHHTSLWAEFRKLCRLAGVDPLGFHGLRKSSASYVDAAGGDVTKHLSHSDPRLAQAHYVDPTISRPASALNLLPDLRLCTAVVRMAGGGD